jgi:SMI1 / KNR4 family (SUKH-1)
MKKILEFLTNNCKIYGKLTEEDVLNFETKVSIKFDYDYRDFLIKTNGVFVNNKLQIYIDELEESVGIQVIYGISTTVEENNIDFWLSELNGEIPEKAVVLGRDPGSNHFIFHAEGDKKGIYYYDSSFFFEDSDEDEVDEVSKYFVSSTFTQFLEKITEYTED